MWMSLRAAIAGCLAIVLAVAAASVAAADWRDDFLVLRVGVVTGPESAYRVATLEPFRVYLQDRTGVPVEIVPAATYQALIDAQAGGQVHYGVYSATSFATALVSCECVEAIGAPVAADGAFGFHSILVSAAGSGIDSLADAQGRRIALAGPDSVAGRLIPMRAFAAEGIDPQQFFAEVVTTADPQAAIATLLGGKADVAAAWSSLTGPASAGYDFGALTRLVADGRLQMGQIDIIWQSRLIPFGPHAVRTDIPPELRALLARALVAMSGADPEALDSIDRHGFGGGGFATPDPSLYTVVLDLVRPRTSP